MIVRTGIWRTMALSAASIPVVKKNFHVPKLEELVDVLNKGLKKHFSKINVDVVQCPDLTKSPFNLASKGLSGNPRLVELGGASYLLPVVDKTRVYDVRDVANLSELNPAFMIGAGDGPFPDVGLNCEGIYNLNVNGKSVQQESRISKINLLNGDPIQETLNDSSTVVPILANLYLSEGKPGKVLKVHVSKRIGSENFIASIRTVLAEHFRDKIVGLGGTFLIKEGKAKTHVMPDFSTKPINTEKDLNNWLKFFNMSAPLIAVGTFVTGEFDLDLRVQHFHMFSPHGEAGHYHYDTTPEEVEYLAYFNIAESVYRIDRPLTSHTFGKD